MTALPSFLKTYVDRLTFSFTDYLRNERDSSTELHQWIRRNYTAFASWSSACSHRWP